METPAYKVSRILFIHPDTYELLLINKGNHYGKSIQIDGSSCGYCTVDKSVAYLNIELDSRSSHRLQGHDYFFAHINEEESCHLLMIDPRDPKLWENKYNIKMGAEIEFYIKPSILNNSIEGNKNYCHPRLDMMKHLDNIHQQLVDAGIYVSGYHSEVGEDQFEISLLHTDPKTLADNIVLTKEILKYYAKENEMYLDLSPKPYSNKNGSGCHLHFSVDLDKDVLNLWHISSNPDDREYIQNDLTYGDDLYVDLCANLCNKYSKELSDIFIKGENTSRLVPGFEAPDPSNLYWDHNDRHAAFRIIDNDDDTYHAEFRLPGGDIVPHRDIREFISILQNAIDDTLNDYQDYK